jgi:hypothetical protein
VADAIAGRRPVEELSLLYREPDAAAGLVTATRIARPKPTFT